MIKVPSNGAKATAEMEKVLSDRVAAIFYQIAVKQGHWEDVILDDGVVELMNSQLERLV